MPESESEENSSGYSSDAADPDAETDAEVAAFDDDLVPLDDDAVAAGAAASSNEIGHGSRNAAILACVKFGAILHGTTST